MDVVLSRAHGARSTLLVPAPVTVYTPISRLATRRARAGVLIIHDRCISRAHLPRVTVSIERVIERER